MTPSSAATTVAAAPLAPEAQSFLDTAMTLGVLVVAICLVLVIGAICWNSTHERRPAAPDDYNDDF